MAAYRNIIPPVSSPNRWWRWISTLGPIGSIPRWPGTAGSLAALGAYIVWGGHPSWAMGAAIIVGSVVAAAAIKRAAPAFGPPDPPQIVVDEAIGMWIAVWGVPPSHVFICVAAFALFRLFDIVKPWPICRLEQWPSPWGVLADDVAAGAVVNLLLRWWAV